MGYKTATLYVVRHGETIGNDTKLVMHPDEDVLNATGKKQAELLGKALKEIKFTRVYTSQYPRTRETAEIVLANNAFNTKPPFKIDERLREVGIENSYGDPYGSLLKALIIFLKSEKPLDQFSVKESEPLPEVRARAKAFLLDLLNDIRSSATSEEETILLVSHGACLRLLLEHFTDPSLFSLKGWNKSALNIMRNTGLFQIQLQIPEESDSNTQLCIAEFQKLHDISHYPPDMLANCSLTRLTKTPEGACLSGCFQV